MVNRFQEKFVFLLQFGYTIFEGLDLLGLLINRKSFTFFIVLSII